MAKTGSFCSRKMKEYSKIKVPKLLKMLVPLMTIEGRNQFTAKLHQIAEDKLQVAESERLAYVQARLSKLEQEYATVYFEKQRALQDQSIPK